MNKRIILDILKKYKRTSAYKNNITEIGIFGSFSKNKFTDSSDLDVFVVLNIPKMFDLIGIKQDLEELTHRKVDIIMLRSRMNSFLKKRIDREGIYV